MASITFKGNAVETAGQLPTVGQDAPDFTVVGPDLADITLKSFAGQRLVLNIFPSVDTGVCAKSVRTFNERIASFDNVAVLCVSKDLPFALGRFCGAEGVEHVQVASCFRGSFADDYGVEMTDGPLAGLCSRAVVVVDDSGKVLYTEQVPEIGQDPDIDGALAALQ